MLRAREEIHYRCSALGHLLNLRNVTFNELATIQVKDKDKDVLKFGTWRKLLTTVFKLPPCTQTDDLAKLTFELFYSIHPESSSRIRPRQSYTVDLGEFLIFLYSFKFAHPGFFPVHIGTGISSSDVRSTISPNHHLNHTLSASSPFAPALTASSVSSSLSSTTPTPLPSHTITAMMPQPSAIVLGVAQSPSVTAFGRFVTSHLYNILRLCLDSTSRVYWSQRIHQVNLQALSAQALSLSSTTTQGHSPSSSPLTGPGDTSLATLTSITTSVSSSPSTPSTPRDNLYCTNIPFPIQPHELCRLQILFDVFSAPPSPSIPATISTTTASSSFGSSSSSSSSSSTTSSSPSHPPGLPLSPPQSSSHPLANSSAAPPLSPPSASASSSTTTQHHTPNPPTIASLLTKWDTHVPPSLLSTTIIDVLAAIIINSAAYAFQPPPPLPTPAFLALSALSSPTTPQSPARLTDTHAISPSSPANNPNNHAVVLVDQFHNCSKILHIQPNVLQPSALPPNPFSTAPSAITSSVTMPTPTGYAAIHSLPNATRLCPPAIIRNSSGITIVNHALRPHVVIEHVDHSYINAGVATSAVTIVGCHNCVIACAARSIYIENCTNITLFAYSASAPIVVANPSTFSSTTLSSTSPSFAPLLTTTASTNSSSSTSLTHTQSAPLGKSVTIGPHNTWHPYMVPQAEAAGFLPSSPSTGIFAPIAAPASYTGLGTPFFVSGTLASPNLYDRPWIVLMPQSTQSLTAAPPTPSLLQVPLATSSPARPTLVFYPTATALLASQHEVTAAAKKTPLARPAPSVNSSGLPTPSSSASADILILQAQAAIEAVTLLQPRQFFTTPYPFKIPLSLPLAYQSGSTAPGGLSSSPFPYPPAFKEALIEREKKVRGSKKLIESVAKSVDTQSVEHALQSRFEAWLASQCGGVLKRHVINIEGDGANIGPGPK